MATDTKHARARDGGIGSSGACEGGAGGAGGAGGNGGGCGGCNYAQEVRLTSQETAHLALAELAGGLIRQQAERVEAEATAEDVRWASVARTVARLEGREETAAAALARQALEASMSKAESLHAAAAEVHATASNKAMEALTQILEGRGIPGDGAQSMRLWWELGLAVVGIGEG